jgi:hypothetical protein
MDVEDAGASREGVLLRDGGVVDVGVRGDRLAVELAVVR